jgi:hypothetical protein
MVQVASSRVGSDRRTCSMHKPTPAPFRLRYSAYSTGFASLRARANGTGPRRHKMLAAVTGKPHKITE